MTITVSDDYFFFTDAAGSIRSVPVAGGTATVRASNLTPNIRSMVSDGTHLYVNDGGTLRRYDLPTFTEATINSLRP